MISPRSSVRLLSGALNGRVGEARSREQSQLEEAESWNQLWDVSGLPSFNASLLGHCRTVLDAPAKPQTDSLESRAVHCVRHVRGCTTKAV